jgi:hypothetical protein
MTANAAQLKGTVQRFAWAIHDSRDMKRKEIVDENLRRASVRYTHTETSTDPEKEGTPARPFLNPGEAIHLHAHGHDSALSGFSGETLAVQLSRKFDLEDLAGRVIVLHSCNTGQADFGKHLLEMLVSLGILEQVSLTGTIVYAPVNYLVVEDDGLSYVAKTGVDDSQLRVVPRRSKLQDLGEGWRGWRVSMTGSVEEINNPGGGVIDVLNSRETVKQTRYKPPKVKKKTQYGYYDDPSRYLTVSEQSLLERAMAQNRYPPR